MRKNSPFQSSTIISLGLFASGSLASLLYFSTLFLGNLEQNFLRFELVFFSLFALYLLAIYLVFKQKAITNQTIIITVVFAIVFRLVLLASVPTLSVDIFRYLWDGKVQAAGINPYRFPPQSTELTFLRDNLIYPKIYRPDLRTIYPPLSEAFFALTQLFSRNSVLIFKSFIAMIDAVSIILIMLFLKSKKIDPARVIIYAWSPLVVFEFAHSGHIDVLIIPLVILAIWSKIKNKDALSGIFLGLATLVKLYPAFLIFGLLERKNLRLPFWFTLTILVGYIPYAQVGPKILGSLGTYLGGWGFNFLKYLLSSGLNHFLDNSSAISSIIMLSILLIAGGAVAFRNSEEQNPKSLVPKSPPDEKIIATTILLIGLFLLFSPTIYPWYAIWILPFLSFRPSGFWLAATGLVALVYLPFI